MVKICGLCKLRGLSTGICSAKNAKRFVYTRIKENKRTGQPYKEFSTLFKAISHSCDCDSFIHR